MDLNKTFYKTLKSFLKDLILVFPEDDGFKIITTKIHLAMLEDDDSSIIKSFHKTFLPLSDLIERRDNLFFYHEYWKNSDFELFTKINSFWDELSEHNRKTIWDYIQLIFSISSKIYVQ